jgi:hypothetical protein
MASIVLLLSELMGGRLSLGREFFRPAAMEASAAKQQSQRPAAGTEEEEEKQSAKVESFEDLAVSRIAVDVMWP